MSIAARSYPERIFSFTRIPFWANWSIFWLIIFIIDLYLSIGWQTAHSHFTEFFVCVFHATVVIGIGYARIILSDLYQRLLPSIDGDPSAFTTWYDARMKKTVMGIWPILAGVAYATVTEISVGSVINEFNVTSPAALYFRIGYRLLGFVFIGSAIWSLMMVIMLPSQLTQFKFTVRLGDKSDIGLRGLGVAFFKLSMMTIVCFTISVVVIMVSPIGKDPTVVGSLIFWSIVTLCFFILPQISIHRIMAADKRRQMLLFSNYLQEAMERSAKEPASENFQKLKELFELQNHFSKISTWPFDVSALWQLISALLFPLLLVLLQIFLTGG